MHSQRMVHLIILMACTQFNKLRFLKHTIDRETLVKIWLLSDLDWNTVWRCGVGQLYQGKLRIA